MTESTETTFNHSTAPANPRRWFTANIMLLTLAGGLLAACTGEGFKTDYQIARDRAAAYIAANPALSLEKQAAIRQAKLIAGMSRDEVIASWGRPAIVRTYRDGAQEYWLFGCHWPHICNDSDEDTLFPMPEDIFNSHALFENDRLVSWHG